MRKICSSKQYKNKGTFNLIQKGNKMKYLVFSTGKWEWVKGSGWGKPVSVYNKVEVDDSTETLTEDDIDTDAMYEHLNNEYYEVEGGTDYYYETTLENEDGETLQKIGMWLSDYRKEIAIDKSPEKITRYIISGAEQEIYPRNKHDDPKHHLYEGVVIKEGNCYGEDILGIYKNEEEARKEFSKYDSEIQECGTGVKGLRVTEYFLYKRTFNLAKAIKEIDSINSEEDFDKQLENSLWGCDAYEYLDKEWELGTSSMNILVKVSYGMEDDKYVLFHSYDEAEDFESDAREILYIIKNGEEWDTRIVYGSREDETITEEEFHSWITQMTKKKA